MLALMRNLAISLLVPVIVICAAAKAPVRPSAAIAWHTNFTAAQAQALAEGKLLLVHFSGSDWCGWCIKLRKDVFQQKEFMDYARTNLVLLSVDFPKRKAQPRGIQQTNEALKARFQVEGIPTLLVVKSDGSKLGVLPFGEGGPKTFIRELEKLVDQKSAAGAAEPSVVQTGANAKARPALRGGLHLKGIVDSKGHRVAQINDQTFLAGQSARVRVASGEVNIRCVEIRDTSVIVRVEGRKEPVELKLAQQL